MKVVFDESFFFYESGFDELVLYHTSEIVELHVCSHHGTCPTRANVLSGAVGPDFNLSEFFVTRCAMTTTTVQRSPTLTSGFGQQERQPQSLAHDRPKTPGVQS